MRQLPLRSAAAEGDVGPTSRRASALMVSRAFVVVACLTVVLGSGSVGDAATVIDLHDGTRITADQIEQSAGSNVVVVRIERQGIHLSRHLKISDIRSMTVDGVPAALANASTVVNGDVGPTHVPAGVPDAAAMPPADRFPNLLFRGLPNSAVCLPSTGPGTVIGVRDDPLSAYEDSVSRAFPHGVPQLEVEYALELMRAQRARDVLAPLVLPPQAAPAPGEVPPPAPGPSTFVPARNRVRSISVTARPMNSDGKVDFNSLEIELHALDLEGREVPVHGTVEASLWGQRQELVRSVGTVLTADTADLVKLGEWTRMLNPQTRTSVAADGKTSSSLRFVVPLARPVPDHNFRVAPFGDLHVKLAVPGEGVFEATAEGVTLRHGSPIRRQSLVETGSHFLPGEGTSDNIQPAGSWRFTRPTSGPDRRVLSVEP